MLSYVQKILGWSFLAVLLLTLTAWGPRDSQSVANLWPWRSTNRTEEAKVKWIYPFDAQSILSYSPALHANGTVYTSGCLFALDPQGTLLWRAPSDVCLGDPTPVVGPQGDLYGRNNPLTTKPLVALRSDGTAKWIAAESPFVTFLSSLSAAAELYAVLGLPKFVVVAIDAADGTVKWSFDLRRQHVPQEQKAGEIVEIADSTPPLILEDGTIVIAALVERYLQGSTWEDSLFLDTFSPDGQLRETSELKVEGRVLIIDIRPNDFSTSPPLILAADGTFYLALWERVYQEGNLVIPASRLYNLDLKADVHWMVSLPGIAVTEPVLGPDGTIYLGTVTSGASSDDLYWGTLYALSPQGELKWKFDVPDRYTIEGTPAVGADGVVYLPTEKEGLVGGSQMESGRLYALNPEGEVLWVFETVGGVRSSPALAEDGTLYFVAVGPCSYDVSGNVEQCQGRVYALQTGSPGLADSPWPMFRGDPQHSGRVHVPAQSR